MFCLLFQDFVLLPLQEPLEQTALGRMSQSYRGLGKVLVHREQTKWDMVSAAVSGQGLFGASLVLCNYSYALRNKVHLGAHQQGSACSNVCPLQDCVAFSACVFSTFPVPCLLPECLLRLEVWEMAVGSPSLTGSSVHP